MKPEPNAIRRDWSSGISGEAMPLVRVLLVEKAAQHFVEG